MNQHEWVLGCLRYYAENYYEPGNPEDGEWHDCHYPIPKCLGGTETIKLLKEHHAVQGVLQSDEYQHRCIFGWELEYLSGELLEKGQTWMDATSYTEAQARVKKGVAARTPEQRQESVRKGIETKRANNEAKRAALAERLAQVALARRILT